MITFAAAIAGYIIFFFLSKIVFLTKSEIYYFFPYIGAILGAASGYLLVKNKEREKSSIGLAVSLISLLVGILGTAWSSTGTYKVLFGQTGCDFGACVPSLTVFFTSIIFLLSGAIFTFDRYRRRRNKSSSSNG